MSLALGCIADDYTGASDLANTLARTGLRTIQTIGIPAPALRLDGFDAIVISFKSRSIAAVEAVALAQAAEAWLRGRGVPHVMFKICSTFDSTDLGNIGPVTDALRPRGGALPTLVNSAFPQAGRTIFNGHLFVGTALLEQSPLRDHPLNPMRDSNLVRVLGRQSRGKVDLVPLDVVEKGAAAIRTALEALAARGAASAIVDSVFDRHLEAIGEVAFAQPTSTGASGLGYGLARAVLRSRAGAIEAAPDGTDPAVGGPAAIIAGSCSAATLEQIARAEGTMPVLRLDPQRLVEEPAATTAEALSWARQRLGATPMLIASSAPPTAVADLQARFGKQSGAKIEAALATIAQGLVDAGIRRLVVAGGETAGAVVDTLGLRAFAVGPEIASGVPILEVTSGPYGPMRLALKSGNFGGPGFFGRALELMR